MSVKRSCSPYVSCIVDLQDTSNVWGRLLPTLLVVGADHGGGQDDMSRACKGSKRPIGTGKNPGIVRPPAIGPTAIGAFLHRHQVHLRRSCCWLAGCFVARRQAPTFSDVQYSLQELVQLFKSQLATQSNRICLVESKLQRGLHQQNRMLRDLAYLPLQTHPGLAEAIPLSQMTVSATTMKRFSEECILYSAFFDLQQH